MKNVFKLIPTFIVSYIACVLLGAIVYTLFKFTGLEVLSVNFVERAIKSVALFAAPVSMLAAMLVWSDRGSGGRRPSRILSYLVVGVLGFLFIAGFGLLLAPLGTDKETIKPFSGTVLGKIVYSPSIAFYAGASDPKSPGPVLISNPGRALPPRVSAYSRTSVKSDDGFLSVKSSSGISQAIPDASAEGSAVGNSDDILRRFLSDLASLNGIVYSAAGGPLLRYLATCGAITALFLSIWLFARLTGWGFLNAVLAIAAVRLAVLFLAAMNDPTVIGVIAKAIPSLPIPYSVSLAAGSAAILMIACDALLYAAGKIRGRGGA